MSFWSVFKISSKNKNGFTLIELLVVVAIIGLLSSVVMVSVNSARAKARDARRMSDIDQAIKALALYYSDYGNYIETGSGCGNNNNGTGYFNHTNGSSYLVSIAQCLFNAGYTSQIIIDPTGFTSGNSTNQRPHYMKYHCTQNGQKVVYMYASLETKPRFVDGPTNGTCSDVLDTSYGMNYWKKI